MTTVSARSTSRPSRASGILEDVRSRWAGMAGRIGMGFALAGFFVILVAWNGAAGLDYAQGQLPYLISGGAGGLGLIFLGGSLLVAESNRRDRAVLENQLSELTAAVERLALGSTTALGAATATTATGDLVVAGRSSFHAVGCHLAENRPDAAQMQRSQAETAGLKPCRVCKP